MHHSAHIAEAMTKRVFSVQSKDDLSDTYAMMERHRVRHLPVIDEGVLVGMVSDRDVFRRGNLDDGADVVGRQTVRQVMTRDVRTCKASDTLTYVAGVMTSHHIDALPVVDAGGVVEGIITSTDILRQVVSAGEAGELGGFFDRRVQRDVFGGYGAE